MVNILPGEPIPPGFEDEVGRTLYIKKSLDSYKSSALIGLEYMIEIQHAGNRSEPEYICVLCNKTNNSRSVVSHWSSLSHRQKYLERHYPSAMQELTSIHSMANTQTIMTNVVKRIAEAIEEHYGRSIPTTCNADDFRNLKYKILTEINNKFHCNEQEGPNFAKLTERFLLEFNKAKKKDNLQITIKMPEKISAEVIKLNEKNEMQRIDLDEISSDSDDALESQGPPEKKRTKRTETPKTSLRAIPNVSRSPPFNETRDDSNKRQVSLSSRKLPTPKELSMQASHIAQERYKWEKYYCLLDIQVKKLKVQQDEFDKNPEKHPDYSVEWKKFWNRRYKELQADKTIDPNKYDFKPEWVAFWRDRMVSLFDASIEAVKKEIKLKLGLREDETEKTDHLKQIYKVKVLTPPAPEANTNFQSKELHQKSNKNRSKPHVDVINISDDDSLHNFNRGRHRTSRSHSGTNSVSTNSRSRRRSGSFSISPAPAKRGYRHRYRNTRSRSGSAHDRDRRYAKSPDDHVMRSDRVNRHCDDYRSERHYKKSLYSRMSRTYISSGENYRVLGSHEYPRYSYSDRSVTPSKVQRETKDFKHNIDNGPLTVVGVLRMVSALEEHLGSLGPKALDLLGKALAMEKVKANAADDLLLNEDYCVFLETIKEKLKGLLITDVFEDPQKIRVIQKVITNIAAIIYQVISRENKEIKNEKSQNTKDVTDTLSVGYIGSSMKMFDVPFDRKILSSKLATAFLSEGYDAITISEMNKLMHFFALMLKKKKMKRINDDKILNIREVFGILGLINTNKSTSSALIDDQSKETVNIVQEVEVETDASIDQKNADSNNLESLTDSDLQTLLQNFKYLSNEEQHHLIVHLRKLEKEEPMRVESLRKYVNIIDLAKEIGPCSDILERAAIGKTKLSNCDDAAKSSTVINCNDKTTAVCADVKSNNATVSINSTFSSDDDDNDDDDDYNFDEVLKGMARSREVRKSPSKLTKSEYPTKYSVSANNEKQIEPSQASLNALTFKPPSGKTQLSDTKNLIANLMGSLQQTSSVKFSQQNDLSSKPKQITQSTNERVSDATSFVQKQVQSVIQKYPVHQVHQQITRNVQPEPIVPKQQQLQHSQNQHLHQNSQIQQVNDMTYYQQSAQHGYLTQASTHAPGIHFNPMFGYSNQTPAYGYPQVHQGVWTNNSQFGSTQNYMQPQQQLPYNIYNNSGRG